MDINWNQYKAAGRHVASYAAGGVTVAVAMHVLSPSQGADLQTDVNQIVSGLQSVATGIAGIAGVLVPIYTAWRAAHSASPQQQIAAVAAMPEVKKIEATRELADATPSDKVVPAKESAPTIVNRNSA